MKRLKSLKNLCRNINQTESEIWKIYLLELINSLIRLTIIQLYFQRNANTEKRLIFFYRMRVFIWNSLKYTNILLHFDEEKT